MLTESAETVKERNRRQNCKSTQGLRRAISGIQRSDEPLDDAALDALIGLRSAEPGEGLGDLLLRHGHHRLERGDMTYEVVRRLFRGLDSLPSPSRLIDLGCGYGRIGFYGALLANLPYWGIEIIPERLTEARRVKAHLGLEGVEFARGDALTCQWPEGDCFAIMNSFFPSQLPALAERLKKLSRQRPLVIASISTSNHFFETQAWLREIRLGGGPPGKTSRVRFFTSNDSESVSRFSESQSGLSPTASMG